MKKKITIISIIIGVILIGSIITSIIINNQNKNNKNQKLYICIYQYHVLDYHYDTSFDRTLLYKMEFNKETSFDQVIESIDQSVTNHVVISNGICKVTEATCKNHICMASQISCDVEYINETSISCLPSGLYITIEYE